MDQTHHTYDIEYTCVFTIPYLPPVARQSVQVLGQLVVTGIIRLLQSPFTSQVVIMEKKTREIHLCMDYQKLNSVMVRDAFLLPRIDESLQAIHSSN